MNITKKLEKELLFKNNIKEITSISLDSEYKVDNNELVGNFIITGDYKLHEISLNREKFNFKVPFKIEIEPNIDLDTIKLEITNFEYDYRKDELLVNIEYEINGDRKDVLIFDTEESLDDFLNNREIEVIDTRIDEIKEETKIIEKNEELPKQEESKEILIEEKDKKIERKDIDREVIAPDEIINSFEKPKDNFITYKIYKISETDTLESIVLKYKTTIDELKEYNDLTNIGINDKIIIPYYE